VRGATTAAGAPLPWFPSGYGLSYLEQLGHRATDLLSVPPHCSLSRSDGRRPIRVARRLRSSRGAQALVGRAPRLPAIGTLVRACALLFEGCHDPIPDPPERPPAEVTRPAKVVLEPDLSFDSAASVLRFVVTPATGAQPSPESFWLFRDELSSYYGSRLQRGELPTALLERQVPTLAWVRDPCIVVAPIVPLALGQRYSLGALGIGLVSTIQVAGDARLPWPRLWPPPGTPSRGGEAIYCGPDAGLLELEFRATWLEPGPWAAIAQPGVDDEGTARDGCLTLRALGSLPTGFTFLPPPRVGQVPLDPQPLGTQAAEPAVPLPCQEPEVEFGPGCALVEDDRLALRVPAAPLLWTVRGLGAPWVKDSLVGGTLTITGLAPDRELELTVGTLDLSGTLTEDVVRVKTTLPRPHLVLNEVLANPVGPEPQQEWIELYNDGSEPIDLTGLRLFDASGESILPAAGLSAGAFALLVREDYDPESGIDQPPVSGTLLVRLPQLGKNGLGNAGEALRIEAPDGRVLSRFPAVAQALAGTSAVRREPTARDDDPTAFGLNRSNGASPGAHNPTSEPLP
jgi:hypothetical protein